MEEPRLSSRKFMLAVLSICIIAGLTLASEWMLNIQNVLITCTSSILGILGLYFTGNVVAQAVGNKVTSTKQ